MSALITWLLTNRWGRFITMLCTLLAAALLLTSCADVDTSDTHKVVKIAGGLYRVTDTLETGTIIVCYYNATDGRSGMSCLDDPARQPAEEEE